MSVCVSVLNDQGNTVSVQLKCTFSFGGSEYALFEHEGKKEHRVGRLSYSLWNGTRLHGGRVSEKVTAVAKRLIDKNDTRPDVYFFEGEHYEVYEKTLSDGSRDIGMRRNGDGLMRFRVLGVGFPLLLKIMFSMLVAICVTNAYTRFCMLFPSVVFPDTPISNVKDTLRIVGYCGCVLMFLICRKMDMFHLTLNGFIPMGAITLAAGFSESKVFRIIIIISAAAMLALYTLPKLMTSAVTSIKRRNSNILADGLHSAVYSVGIFVAVFSIAISYYGFAGGFSDTVKPVTPPTPESVIENYESVLTLLNEEVWESLTVEERTDVLRKICDYECEYVLGIEPVNFAVEMIGGKTLLGCYSDSERKIYINTHVVEEEGPALAVETLLHEARHSWQYAVADMYDQLKPYLTEKHKALSFIRDAANFEKNMCDLYDDSNDFSYYLHSAMEQDSRSWSTAQLIANYSDYIYSEKEE